MMDDFTSKSNSMQLTHTRLFLSCGTKQPKHLVNNVPQARGKNDTDFAGYLDIPRKTIIGAPCNIRDLGSLPTLSAVSLNNPFEPIADIGHK
ncbi:hypothetical protein [Ruegeria sp. HKCCA4812]|uniref:hypothetical protein n=1 Tax=Ruegeria sp. HKCCA4812 TaxID=2682993 RepID=UPI001489B652|nr:hypothetical protein [Ruegeria sp. HKCCA4812]